MGYHETTVPEGNSTVLSPDLQSPTDFFASATAIRNLILQNSPNPDALTSQIPEPAFPVFQKAVNSGEFLTENSLDSILSYCLMKENGEKPFFLHGCFRRSCPKDHKSAESSVVLFPVCICFKNQRADSDKDTEGIASYYIKYPHCTHSDSLCQGSWFPQRKQRTAKPDQAAQPNSSYHQACGRPKSFGQ